MALPDRLASAAARTELASILREFAAMEEPADSIGDRAVRIGTYNRDTAVLVPLSDFERALENEELLDDLLLEVTLAERLARGPGKVLTLEEVARELGLADELGLE
jgi:PHD/YefM family antitoxin component YafN of YafNO toxin-antitoxin module